MKVLKMKFFTLAMMLVFTMGCSESKFSGIAKNPYENLSTHYGEALMFKDGTPPVAIAHGGSLYVDYTVSDESGVAVESLIGQSINSKVHSKNGVRVNIGYPELQSSFAYE